MTAGWVVVGVDGGVGTTTVVAALARAAGAAGTPVVHVKPVQPGAADGADDAADVAALAGVPTVVGAAVGPAGAPGRTARRAGLSLTGRELAAVVEAARADHVGAVLLVEGAGGVLAELGSDGTTVADLAVGAELPAVVVADAREGAPERTALTVEALTRRGTPVVGVIVTAGASGGALDDADEVAARAGVPLLGVVPVLDLAAPDPLAPAVAPLGAAVRALPTGATRS